MAHATVGAEQGRIPSRNEAQLPHLALSNAMVGLYKELFGRGPQRATTHFAGPDTVVVTLRGSLTQAERNLVALGENQRLRDARMFFQSATEQQFRETVEGIVGRRVVGFVSGIDVAQDVSAEVFYLEPRAPAEIT
jgi:uncharacterized protein YbcI